MILASTNLQILMVILIAANQKKKKKCNKKTIFSDILFNMCIAVSYLKQWQAKQQYKNCVNTRQFKGSSWHQNIECKKYQVHFEFKKYQGLIDVELSDHQIIYCTRKISRIKRGTQKQIRCHSLRNYSADIHEEGLGRLDFPNYRNFENINDAYSNCIQKVMGVIDLVAHIKSKRIKQKSQDWFDGEVAAKISVRDKLFKKLKNQNFTLTKKCIK